MLLNPNQLINHFAKRTVTCSLERYHKTLLMSTTENFRFIDSLSGKSAKS